MTFKPYLSEQTPEPWWKRLYACLFLCLLLSGLFAGAVFLQQTGVIGGGRGNRIATENVQNVERANARIYFFTKAAAVVGAASGLAISAYFELRKK